MCVCVCVWQDSEELCGVSEQIINQIKLSSGLCALSYLQYEASDPTLSRFDVSALNVSSLPLSTPVTYPSSTTYNDVIRVSDN